MKHSAKRLAFLFCLLSGIMLIFIGLRFFITPLSAEFDYGIHTNTGGDFSFQYIKGVRDFFFGLIIIALLWKKQWLSLGLVLLLGAVIPTMDFLIVISHPGYVSDCLYAHFIAVVICIACGLYYIKNAQKL